MRRSHEGRASVFTAWFRWTFLGGSEAPPAGEEIAGFAVGLPALANLASTLLAGSILPDGDFGPYEQWTRPLLLARAGREQEATALDGVPDPPHDLLLEVLWFLVGQAALDIGHAEAARRAHDALLPASTERAAGSGVVDLGPISALMVGLTDLTAQPST